MSWIHRNIFSFKGHISKVKSLFYQCYQGQRAALAFEWKQKNLTEELKKILLLLGPLFRKCLLKHVSLNQPIVTSHSKTSLIHTSHVIHGFSTRVGYEQYGNYLQNVNILFPFYLLFVHEGKKNNKTHNKRLLDSLRTASNSVKLGKYEYLLYSDTVTDSVTSFSPSVAP